MRRAGDLADRHLLSLLVALGALLRISTLSVQAFWLDENSTLETIRLDGSSFFGRILETEANPPGYFALAAVWERVFGDSELAIRSLSALAGSAAIVVVYAAARALGSRRAGLIAAALTATSPFLIWYSQEARAYSLVTLLGALTFLCFAHLLQGGGPAWLWGWALASIAAIGVHYFAGALVAVEAGWLLWARPRPRAEVALAVAAVGVAVLPLVPLALAQRELVAWIPTIDLGGRLLQLPAHFAIGMASPWAILAPLSVLVFAAAIAVGFRRGSPTSRRVAAIAGGVAALGVCFAVLAAAAGSDSILSRSLIGFWAPVAIGAAGALAAPSLWRLGAAFTAVACALGVALTIWVAATPAAGRPDFDQLAARLGAPAGDRVIAGPIYTGSLTHYLPDTTLASGDPSPPVSELDVVDLRPVTDYSIGTCWWLAFCGGEYAATDPRPAYPIPAGFELVDQGTTELFEYRRYRSPTPVALPVVGYGDVFVQGAG